MSDDYTTLDRVVMVALMDTRPLVPLITPGGPPDSVCVLIETFGVACSPCTDDEPLCVTVRVEEVPASGGPTPVLPRTLDDIAADPACD